MKIANAWQKYFIDFVQTLTSINPRCSVLKPPIIANWSFISAVIWIFSAANRMIEAILVEWDFRWILWFFFSKQLRKSNISVIIRQFPWKNVMKVIRYPSQNIQKYIWSILPSPVDSIREAVFTVSPNRQYRGIFVPTIPEKTLISFKIIPFSNPEENRIIFQPATTGPVCTPHRICNVSVVLNHNNPE